MKTTVSAFTAILGLALWADAPLAAQTNAPDTAAASTTNAAPSTPEPPASPPATTSRRAARAEEHLDTTATVAVLGSYTVPIVIVGLVFYFRHRRHQMVNETLRLMIEKGVPITPELVDSLKSRPGREARDTVGGPRQRNDLRAGLILMGVGVGIIMLAGKAGWIVFCIGAAFLIVWLFERDKAPSPPPH